MMSPVETPEPRRPFYKNPYFLGFLVGAALLTILPFMQRAFLRAPPPLGDVGAWSLVDQDGNAFGSEQLKGKVWVASFFFTRCPTICPSLLDKQKRMQRAVTDLGDDPGETPIHFVAFTVDPEHDSPAVLKEYATKLGADSARWTFVTGSREDMKKLLVDRMFVDMGVEGVVKDRPDLVDISHSARFALVDQVGQLRALWPTEEGDLGNMINAARLLAKHGPNP